MLLGEETRTVVEKLQERETTLQAWLSENAPECEHLQTHLDDNTAERAYWHFGYMMALRDVLALLGGNASTLRH